MSRSARSSVLKFAVGSVLLAAGCGTPEAFHDTTIDGGLIGRGGTVGTGTGGGIVATGGVIGGIGGTIGSGGTTTTGGSTGSGGSTSIGGTTGTGARGTGGTTASGGTTGTGGRATGTGGSTASGGTTATGGRGTGGATSSGGMTGTGGRATGGATGTGGMATGVLFMDDFENGTSKWQGGAATDWTIVADGTNVYRQGTTGNTWRSVAAGNVVWTNVIVEARVKILTLASGSTGNMVGVCARVADATNRYCMAIRGDSSMTAAIRKVVDGEGMSGASTNVTNGIMLNAWYTVRLEVTGSAITGTLLLNGNQVARATDNNSSITAGGIALGTQNATAVFDDVRVTTP